MLKPQLLRRKKWTTGGCPLQVGTPDQANSKSMSACCHTTMRMMQRGSRGRGSRLRRGQLSSPRNSNTSIDNHSKNILENLNLNPNSKHPRFKLLLVNSEVR